MAEIVYGQFQKETKNLERITESGDLRVTEDNNIRITDDLDINLGYSTLIVRSRYIPFVSRIFNRINSIWKNSQIFVKFHNIWMLPIKGYKKISGIWKRIL